MKILNYKLSSTNELLTARIGLLATAHTINTLSLSNTIDQHFPALGSNCALKASTFINTLILSQHEGGQCLDDTTHIAKDKALRLITNQSVPTPQAIGIWLRRLGEDNQGIKALQKVNKTVLKATLNHCKNITLDIDASEVIANKADAQWTYKKHKGYMPIIGHIAQTGQIVATNFRAGNVSPAKDNLDFIKISQDALPKGTNIKKLRIDAAGYQASIIDYCFEHDIEFSIRAKICQSLKDIFVDKDNQWQPLVDKKGKAIDGQATFRMRHFMGNNGKVFDLVVQRSSVTGQVELDLELDSNNSTQAPEQITSGQYIYRSIATNLETLSDSKVIHFYNQRGEDSENRIKELKNDFGARQMPCGDFNANALYFDICSLSYNLFALMRQILPLEFANKRAKYVRNRFYAIAAKVLQHGRQVIVKCQAQYYDLLTQVLNNIKAFKPLLS
ncbi:IS1380-Spn1, transposase [uncultured Gammaproteobacteria bacterium]|nr:IS1380 family transposase [thiotrophic endosymbiont of Bathymodiolus puteoserpentis (Logatchev)]VVH52315.1 IS1380-Spn1, transposase [uncultured Gammaproteobacteria bacterium]SSC09556.1 IS1380-Spn1, transposase [thiotrophic endosymbiont of Bathymodiolus puteoserpentis (Logatchev)]SSC10683.1 IS1380-Spn1, transposase [thiotrophic endosymbiont of Bathymodiolus puteoserpentis (Logatchev)]SSC11097.1 IS1380-Spn1, transposase [thiotrophic endosymbiont of Bathymodiolus puteoserpentis (Logatchev)]SSC